MKNLLLYGNRMFIACVLLLLFSTISIAQFNPIPDTQRPTDGMGYLDNGTVKIGVNLNFGACITYLSRSGSSTNLVNNSDHGRQAQYSLYNGPDDFAQGSTDPNWRTLGWNPIEAGDHINNGPTVLNYANTGTTIYTKIRPLFWPLQNQEAECYFEKWITLDGNAAKVHFKVTMFRSDTRFFAAHPQELPCFYSIAEQYQHVVYEGEQPFTNGATTTYQMNAGQWQVGQYAPENWIGMKNPNTGDLAALWVKDVYEFVRWKIGNTTSGGEFGGDATYVTALPFMIFDHNKAYETDAAFLVGTESQVRNWVMAQPRPATLPNFQFNNSRERWTYYGNVTDPGEPNGELDVSISNESNWVLSTPQVFYKASDLSTIYLKAKITGNITDMHIGWNKMGESSSDVVTSNQYTSFPVYNDGASHVYAIPVSNHPNWNGSIKGFKFFHGPTSPTLTTGNIKIESVTYNDPGGSDPCDFSLSTNASDNNPQAGSSVTLTAGCTGQCSGVTYSWSGNGISGSGSTVTFNAPSTSGSYTYTLTASKSGCSNKTSTITLNVGSGSNCGYVDKQTVGTWSGLNVQTRLYTVNGTPTWLIVTAVNGSSTDKHYPRGKNFADRGDISWTNGVINKTCLGGEETAWGGLGMPSGVSVPSGYSQGTEQDGAVYFQQSCSPPSAPSLSASPSTITSGSSATLTAAGCSGGTITWSNGLGTGTSKTVSPTSTTVYTATCTISGCTSSNGSVTVTVNGGSTNDCNGLEGHFDNAGCDIISGWIYRSTSPNTVVNIDIYEGSNLIQSNIPANLFRQDLVDAGKGNGIHGFIISTPAALKDGQSHSITLKATGCSTYSLVNSPRTISGCTGGCTAPSAPSLTASPSTITSGNTVTLSANGCSGGTITWSNSLGTGNSKTVSPTTTTTYTATCTVDGCTSTAGSVTVTVDPSSNVNCNTLEGYFDVGTCSLIYGWAYDASHPNDPINVDLYDGSTLIMANILANTYRSDLQGAGKGNGVHGYQLSTPAALLDGQSHSLSIKVSGCNYTLTNSPKTISGCSGSSLLIGDEGVADDVRKLRVTPNPSNGSLYANFYLGLGKQATLRITDMHGRTIFQKKINGNGWHREQIDLVNKSSGTLFLQLITAQGAGVQKIQIVR